MKRLIPIHGRELISIRCNRFCFRLIRQKGSHATLYNGRIHVTVPIKEIRVGLLNVMLKDCGISRKDFLENL